jgi:cation-transporting P-type ATPase E
VKPELDDRRTNDGRATGDPTPPVPAPLPDGVVGLTDDEVADRVSRGLVNRAPDGTGRTFGQIVRANVFTRFNAILGTLLVVILTVGPLQDALFGIVLVTNALIGIVQEWRAKRTLDRLTLLSAEPVAVARDGERREIPVHDVVADDLVELGPGSQIVTDGSVVNADELEVDESLLTGESVPIDKSPGDRVLSGSFVTAGSGWYRTEAVGAESYANQLASEARRFSLVRSELRRGTDTILRYTTWLIIPTAALLIASQLRVNTSLPGAIRGSVAGIGSMIPEGLVLLTSVAFAASIIRLGRRRVLVQELAAIEGLARVDVVCIDKTGTITEPTLVVAACRMLGDPGSSDVDGALGALAASDPDPNASLRAIGERFDAPGWRTAWRVPFSSARRWSGAGFEGGGDWVMGAPDVLLDATTDGALADEAADLVDAESREGRRVLLLVRLEDGPPPGVSPGGTAADGASPAGPDGEESGARGRVREVPAGAPVAVISIEEQVRPTAPDTLAFFAAQGVTVKVLSGDDPRTVGAVAGRVGIAHADRPRDAGELPEDPDELADVVESTGVFGRVGPQQKKAMVQALQARGHTVAMTGDGVNDVLALKEADLGVAMGSGSPASRSVAPVVLMDSSFASLPSVLAEGRRVIANVERVANLFLTKTVYATILALSVGVARIPFPFLPRHLTIISSLTIGIPAFFLALAPNNRRAQPGFVARVLRFAGPTGIVAATATLTAYGLARIETGVTQTEARTTATVTLFLVALWVLAILARPTNPWRAGLVLAMGGTFVGLLAWPWARDVFALNLPSLQLSLAAVAVAVGSGLILEVGWHWTGWVPPHERNQAPDADIGGPAGGAVGDPDGEPRGEPDAGATGPSPADAARPEEPLGGSPGGGAHR